MGQPSYWQWPLPQSALGASAAPAELNIAQNIMVISSTGIEGQAGDELLVTAYARIPAV